MSLPLTGVSELVLEVADLEVAERFYCGALGLPVVERWPEEATWVMVGDQTRIGLWRPRVGVAGGRGGVHVHFALHLAEPAFDDAVSRLRAFHLEPQLERRRTGSRSIYVDDPDGNCVELWTQDVSRYLRRLMAPAQHPEEANAPAYFDATADRWDASYDRVDVRAHWWQSRCARVVALLGDGPGSVLDVGVGSGRIFAALAEHGWSVTGIDPAPRMVDVTRARVRAAAERLTVARAEDLPFPDAAFDAVVAIGVLEYTDMEVSLRELVRVLRPGGRAVIALRNGRAPAAVWQRLVVHPVARAAKRIAPFGRPLPKGRRRPLSPGELRELMISIGLVLQHTEHVGCAALPDPVDYFAPRLAYRAARRAERFPQLRRLLGTQLVVLATKPSEDTAVTADLAADRNRTRGRPERSG